MRKGLPSPAMLLAFAALCVALGGTAFAVVKIKKNSIDSRELANKAIGKRQLDKDAVVSNRIKDGKVTAADAGFYESPGLIVIDAGAESASAGEVVLAQRGAISVVGRCYFDAGALIATVNAASTGAGAVLASDGGGDDHSGNPAYLGPETLLDDRQIASTTAPAVGDTSNTPPRRFMLAQGGASIQGTVTLFAKSGELATGTGPYGAGNRCLFNLAAAAAG